MPTVLQDAFPVRYKPCIYNYYRRMMMVSSWLDDEFTKQRRLQASADAVFTLSTTSTSKFDKQQFKQWIPTRQIINITKTYSLTGTKHQLRATSTIWQIYTTYKGTNSIHEIWSLFFHSNSSSICLWSYRSILFISFICTYTSTTQEAKIAWINETQLTAVKWDYPIQHATYGYVCYC